VSGRYDRITGGVNSISFMLSEVLSVAGGTNGA
jgi:hypothetical protein